MQPYYFGREECVHAINGNLLLNDIEAVHETPSRD